MPLILPEKSSDYPVRYFRPDAAAYFLRGFSFGDFKTKGDLQKYFSGLVTKTGDTEQLHYVANPDILSMSVKLTVQNSPSRFTLRISNRGDKWFVRDDPTEEIPKLRTLSEGESADDRLKKLIPEGATVDTNRGSKYPFVSFEDWWNHCSYVYVEQDELNAGREAFRSLVYREENRSGNVRYYYFNRDGDRVDLTGITLESTSYEKYTIQATDTLESISQDFLQSSNLWIMLKGFYNNPKVFTPEKEPVLGDTYLGAFVGEEIHIPLIREGLSSNARILATPNNTLYWKLAGSMDARGRCVFGPMDRVVLFLKGRFAPTEKPLMRVFTGLVDAVSEEFDPNGQTITIQGSDVTKWLLLTQYNINPALFPVADILEAQNNNNLAIFTNVLAGKTGSQIVRDVILGGVWNLWTENIEGGASLPIGGAAALSGAGPFIKESKKERGRSKFVETPDFGYDFHYVPSGILALASAELKEELQRPYRLWIQDPFSEQYKDSTGELDSLTPYRKYWRNSFELWQSEYTNRRQICYDAAQKTNFLFYADGNGDIHYRQPRYDLGHILGAVNPEIYVLDDESLLSWNASESDEELATRVYVMGETDYLQLSDADKFLIGAFGVYEDANLASTFGQRIHVVSEPMIGPGGVGSTDTTDYYYYAKSLLQRIARQRFSASASLTGRAELTPGFPMFVPFRNRIYFIEEVSHEYQQGKSCTTSVNLRYGRKPWEVLEELLTYKAIGILGPQEALKYMSRLGLAEVLFTQDVVGPHITLSEFVTHLRYSMGASIEAKYFDANTELADNSLQFSWAIPAGRSISLKPIAPGVVKQIVRSGSDYVYHIAVGKLSTGGTSSISVNNELSFQAESVIEMTYVIPSGDRATAEAFTTNADLRKQVREMNTQDRPFLCQNLQSVSWPRCYITIGGELISPTNLSQFEKRDLGGRIDPLSFVF